MATKTLVKCPRCEMPHVQWSTDEGFTLKGVTYCCEGCAENLGCICDAEDITPADEES